MSTTTLKGMRSLFKWMKAKRQRTCRRLTSMTFSSNRPSEITARCRGKSGTMKSNSWMRTASASPECPSSRTPTSLPPTRLPSTWTEWLTATHNHPSSPGRTSSRTRSSSARSPQRTSSSATSSSPRSSRVGSPKRTSPSSRKWTVRRSRWEGLRSPWGRRMIWRSWRLTWWRKSLTGFSRGIWWRPRGRFIAIVTTCRRRIS